MTISYKAQKNCNRLTDYPTTEKIPFLVDTAANCSVGVLSPDSPVGSVNSCSDASLNRTMAGDCTHPHVVSNPCLLLAQGYRVVYDACKLVYARIGAFGRKDIVAEVESHKEWDWKGDDPTIRRYVGGLATGGYLIMLRRDQYIVGAKK